MALVKVLSHKPAEQGLTLVTLLTAPVVLGSVRGSLQTLALVPREKLSR